MAHEAKIICLDPYKKNFSDPWSKLSLNNILVEIKRILIWL